MSLPRLDCLLSPLGDPPCPIPRPPSSAALLAGALWNPGLAKRRAERARRGGVGRPARITAAEEGDGGASSGTAAAVLGSWKRLRGMGRAEAMAAYLALAAQCPGFGAARYDVLELSTVRGEGRRGTGGRAEHLCPRAASACWAARLETPGVTAPPSPSPILPPA